MTLEQKLKDWVKKHNYIFFKASGKTHKYIESEEVIKELLEVFKK